MGVGLAPLPHLLRPLSNLSGFKPPVFPSADPLSTPGPQDNDFAVLAGVLYAIEEVYYTAWRSCATAEPQYQPCIARWASPAFRKQASFYGWSAPGIRGGGSYGVAVQGEMQKFCCFALILAKYLWLSVCVFFVCISLYCSGQEGVGENRHCHGKCFLGRLTRQVCDCHDQAPHSSRATPTPGG